MSFSINDSNEEEKKLKVNLAKQNVNGISISNEKEEKNKSINDIRHMLYKFTEEEVITKQRSLTENENTLLKLPKNEINASSNENLKNNDTKNPQVNSCDKTLYTLSSLYANTASSIISNEENEQSSLVTKRRDKYSNLQELINKINSK